MTEEEIYKQIEQQNDAPIASLEEAKADREVEGLVDRHMINLLKAVSLLRRPEPAEVDQKAVFLGERTRQKLLILDMDETMIHSKFHKITPEQLADPNAFSPGLRPDEKGCMHFNILISSKPGQPPTLRLNVKVR
jgi:hypothetical protein